MKQGADMATLVITHHTTGDRFSYTFLNNAKLGFPVSNSTSSGVPLTRREMKEAFDRMLDQCMPDKEDY